jgi:NADH-quinone oxidoreductase subunit J
MLTAQGPFITMKTSAAEWAFSTAVGLLLYGVIAVSLLVPVKDSKQSLDFARGPVAEVDPGQSRNTLNIGKSFLGVREATPAGRITGTTAAKPPERTRVAYLLPFEIVSVHLLVVLIGAAYLARAKRRRGATQ